MGVNARIAKNTVLLSVRLVLQIIIQLYTVPVVLRALGVSDYGLYSVVCGVVTMFSFVGMSLASGSQRFIAYSLGLQDEKLLKKTFDTILSIYMIFAIVAVVCLEAGGLWFLNHKMNIPPGRMSAANVIFQLSIVSFIAELITIPFVSTVIAYEKMNFYACLGILKCTLQLCVAIVLQFVLLEKLIVYGVLTCMISLIVNGIYWEYCRSHFKECRRIRLFWDRQTGGELLSYSGWNAVGCVALISRQQGFNLLLNLFFGTLVNAAHSIAQQIYGALNQFANNLYMATRPQITKYYAVGEVGKMWELVFRSAKMAFYILSILAIPLIIEMETVLKVWLGTVPPYTASIAILIILSLLIETQLSQIIAVFQAVNKIRSVQLYSSTVLLINIPLTYCVLKWMGGECLVPYVISVGVSILYIATILWQAKAVISLDIKEYVLRIMTRLWIVFIAGFLAIAFLSRFMEPSLLRMVCTFVCSLIFLPALIWLVGLERAEKRLCIQFAENKFRHYCMKN